MSSSPRFRSPTLAALFQDAVKAGWKWRVGKHVVLYPPDGSPPIMLSMTAYDGKQNQNLVALCRRHGLRPR